MHSLLLSPTRFLSGFVIAVGTLSVAACAPEFDEATASSDVEALVEDAHPGLAELPAIANLVVRDDDAVSFVSGRLGESLTKVTDVFGLEASTLTLESVSLDDDGWTHQRFSQTRNGLPVIAGDIRVTSNSRGEIVAASGAAWTDAAIADAPSISALSSLELARDASPGATSALDAELVYVARQEGAPVLAWQTVVKGMNGDIPRHDLVFVDAITGEIAARHPKIHTARNRATFTANNTGGNGQQPQTQLVRDEASNPSGDLDIDRAHTAAGETYDCLQGFFGRDSYDGAGATLRSVAHLGVNLQNAYWDGIEMSYGDGFAVSDVGTHEFGHAVTERTANLVYQNEPGALNEASSDILSAICQVYAIDPTMGATSVTKAKTWTLGEDLNIGAIRFMDDPASDNQSSDHMLTKYTGTQDNGGVHLNSGIANLQFVLMVQGGNHPRRPGEQLVVGMGMADSAKIFFRALTSYMNSQTNFLAARAASEMAATQEFGATSSQFYTVQEAWYAVGVGGPPGVRPEPEPEPEPEPDPNDPDGPGGPGGGVGTPGGNLAGGCQSSGGGAGGLGCLILLGAFLTLRRRRR